jgi:hypothetical protein
MASVRCVPRNGVGRERALAAPVSIALNFLRPFRALRDCRKHPFDMNVLILFLRRNRDMLVDPIRIEQAAKRGTLTISPNADNSFHAQCTKQAHGGIGKGRGRPEPGRSELVALMSALRPPRSFDAAPGEPGTGHSASGGATLDKLLVETREPSC